MRKPYKPVTNDWFSLPIEPEYRTRFIPARDSNKLIGYYHLAKCALSGLRTECGSPTNLSRLERMQWAAKAYARENPDVSVMGAYKDLDGLLR